MSEEKFRVGVVCEGPTDYHAISCFVGASLNANGIAVEFVPLQPDMGKSKPVAGWGNIEKWFENNTAINRVKRFFGGGLFDLNLDTRQCDAIFIQMDSDHIEGDSFANHIRRTLSIEVGTPTEPNDRGKTISDVLTRWSGVEALTEVDRNRHIFAPAVESTETWCIGAFKKWGDDLEKLRGSELVKRFNDVLHRSEGRKSPGTDNIDKNETRRKKFCETQASGSHPRLSEQCAHFTAAVNKLSLLKAR